jgi:hypothetical protein
VSTRGHRWVWRYDPVLDHRYISGLRARIEHEGGGYLLQTNSEGFRCHHQFVSAREPGTRRVLVFGDSFMARTGVCDGRRQGNLIDCPARTCSTSRSPAAASISSCWRCVSPFAPCVERGDIGGAFARRRDLHRESDEVTLLCWFRDQELQPHESAT